MRHFELKSLKHQLSKTFFRLSKIYGCSQFGDIMKSKNKLKVAFTALFLLVVGHLIFLGVTPFFLGFLITCSCVWLILGAKEISSMPGHLIYLVFTVGFFITLTAGINFEVGAGFFGIAGMWVASTAGGATAALLNLLIKKNPAEPDDGETGLETRAE